MTERWAAAAHSLIDAPDEASLVNAARRGDRRAFGHLYDRYAPVVHGILLARVPFGEVDDLVHDVFLLALDRLHVLRDCGRFGAWLAAISRNCASDYHRRSRQTGPSTEALPEEQLPAQDANALHDVGAEEILAMVRSLPESYRETLILRLVEGMTGPEIASRTGLTPGSVRVNLHRGMQLLRQRLGRSGQNLMIHPHPAEAGGTAEE